MVTGAHDTLPPGLSVVLFHHGDPGALGEAFEVAPWPASYPMRRVDLSSDEEARGWFKLGEQDAVAIVADGVILAIEYSCDDVARRRLLRAARRQIALMDEI